jgi:hypothetical protein
MTEISQEIEEIQKSKKLSPEKKQKMTDPLFMKLTHLRECGVENVR